MTPVLLTLTTTSFLLLAVVVACEVVEWVVR